MRNDFPNKLKTIEDAPEPFRRALREQLSPADSVELLVYGPPYQFGASRKPGSLLAIADTRWLAAVADDEGEVAASVYQSDYANTLLLEVTSVLLYGCLKIDFTTGGPAQNVRVYFNTVMDHLYQHAAQLLLDKMDSVGKPPPPETPKMPAQLEPLPMKFQSAILHATPEGERLLEVVHCSVVLGHKRLWFQRELAPEAVLSLTDRELMIVSDEKSWSWLPRAREAKYGSVVTHCPFSRFAGFHIERREGVATLTLRTHAAQGGDTFQIDFPSEKEREIVALMEHAIGENHV
jgi:hypothetical protein